MRQETLLLNIIKEGMGNPGRNTELCVPKIELSDLERSILNAMSDDDYTTSDGETDGEDEITLQSLTHANFQKLVRYALKVFGVPGGYERNLEECKAGNEEAISLKKVWYQLFETIETFERKVVAILGPIATEASGARRMLTCTIDDTTYVEFHPNPYAEHLRCEKKFDLARSPEEDVSYSHYTLGEDNPGLHRVEEGSLELLGAILTLGQLPSRIVEVATSTTGDVESLWSDVEVTKNVLEQIL